jgi:hypothetical protein
MQLLGSRFLDRRILLQDDPDMRSVRTASWAPRWTTSPMAKRQHDAGKQHGLPDRQHDHGIRGNRRMLLALPDVR